MKDVIISDRQDITRIGVEHLLGEENSMLSVSKVEGKSDLIHRLTLHPDAFIVLDYTLSDFGSADELLNVSQRFSKSHWLLFSEELSGEFLRRLLFSSESFSVVLKMCTDDEINAALAQGLRGERFICSRVTNQILLSQRVVSQKTHEILTATEKEILKEIASGKTTKEIAASRNLSFHTIITHRKNIFRKLEINNVHEATKYAMRAGIIDMSDYYI